MKTTRKRKPKRFKLVTFTRTLFVFSVFLYLVSSLFLRTINNSLSTEVQDLQNQIAQIEQENEFIEIEIAQLSRRDRVDNIADENGLRMEEDNIVTITTVAYNGE
ncbi:MAG: hypothetical protein IKE51_04980 [Solobacterium sp.]|nr:hypothetical protein [Solobacterium sp.]